MDTTVTNTNIKGNGKGNSEAKVITARVNGAKSSGPASVEGRAISAANSITHAITASSTLLPSERAEDYRACIDDWTESLRPASAAEARLVARIGDLDFRVRRVQQMEDRHQATMLEATIKESPVFKKFQTARDARLGMAAMIDTVTGVTNCTGDQVAQLLAPIREVAGWLGGLDLPAEVSVPLEETIKELAIQATLDVVDADIFGKLITAAANMVEALDNQVCNLESEVMAEREKIANEVMLGDDKQLKRLWRYKGMINKQLDAELARYKSVRELAQGSTLGSFCTGISVELKVIGGKKL